MDNKQIQEQRMRGYFLDSAKNLLKGEGLKSISVRNVAHHAGYSYATLYNYFKDLNDLIFHCVEDFQQEAREFIERKTTGVPDGREKIKAIARAYVDYFIEYPGVFELFFLERMGDIGNKSATADLIYSFLDRLTAPQWEVCVKEGVWSEEEAAKRGDRIRFAVMGMLLFYENRMHPATYADFTKQVDSQLDDILA